MQDYHNPSPTLSLKKKAGSIIGSTSSTKRSSSNTSKPMIAKKLQNFISKLPLDLFHPPPPRLNSYKPSDQPISTSSFPFQQPPPPPSLSQPPPS